MKKRYISDIKKLILEWDYEKNSSMGLYPERITHASTKLVWWKCSACGYSWSQSPASRTSRNSICPSCSGKALIPGKNDLATVFPEISETWDYEKNGPLTPRDVKPFSNKKVWWKCANNHSYSMRIGHRSSGHSCPFCAGTRVLSGETDFETWCKKSGKEYLLSEWVEGIGEFTPREVSHSSKQKVLWECRVCGHRWTATISSRGNNIMCPKCANRVKTSFPEQALLFYILKLFPDAMSRYRNKALNISELDIFIPSLSVGIEYDGKAWHSSDKVAYKEKQKYDSCNKAKIKLIRVREVGLPNRDVFCDSMIESPYTTLRTNYNEFDKCIQKVLTLLNPSMSIKVDTQKDRLLILEAFYTNLLEGSLLERFPEIASEWHPMLNGRITPAMVPAHSNERFFFLCPLGHEYEAVISKRTMRNDSCPFCSGRQVLAGFNDLATTHPELIKEWDYERNADVSPCKISKGYEKKVWWKCSSGHSFYVSPNTRTSQGVGCPKCKGGVSKPVAAYNLSGKFMASFSSASEAAKNYGVTLGAISAACKKHTPCLGMQFRYLTRNDTHDIGVYIRKPINNKPVVQYALDGKRIASFESVSAAIKATGVVKIGEVCNGRRKTAGGYVWKFEKQD